MSVAVELHLGFWSYVYLFGAAFGAGLIDAIAGGGGLITIPVLLSVGMPPQFALGTNKLQSSFGSGSAMVHFVRRGAISLREGLEGVLCTAIGAALGAWGVQQVDPGFLRGVIPFLLIAIALYTLFSPRLGMEDIHPRMRPGLFYLVFGLLIGFYDGFFGPGTGSFWVIAFMLGLGFNMTKATGFTKVMNFTSNIVSLAVFIVGGHVIWLAGIIMGIGQLLGARIGAGLVISRGTRFVRPVFVTVALAITAKLLYDGCR